MPEIELDDSQFEYLEQLQTDLAEEHIGEYGHVRHRDVVQFLIDRYQAAEAEIVDGSGSAPKTDDSGSKGTVTEDIESEDENETESDEATESKDGASRLQRMMGLLDRHEDVWEQDDHDKGKYAVSLPDGTTEHVRTKDDVRALLFRHYD